MLIKSIMWDTNNDNEALASLPDEIETPNFLHQEDYKTMDDFFAAVAEWLIYEFGWCHFGFQAIVNDNTYDVSYGSLCDECSKRLNEQVHGKYETPWQKVEQGREERSTPWWFDL